MVDLHAVVEKLARNDTAERATDTGQVHLNSRVDFYSDGSGLWVRTSAIHRDGSVSIPHNYSDPQFLSSFHITQSQLTIDSIEHAKRVLEIPDSLAPILDLATVCQALCKFESISGEGFNVADVCLHVYSDGSGFIGLTWAKSGDESQFKQMIKGTIPSPENLKFTDLSELKNILRL